MNVLLIQPPEPPPPVLSSEPSNGDTHLFAPPWNLLCLRAYLIDHTRHLCELVDGRFFHDFETELIQTIERFPETGMVVVNTSSLSLGQTAAVLDIVKRHFPHIKTALCGQHPSQFPEHVAAIPRVDFALAGDPEPILRNLLDYLDVEQRLRRIPGLIIPHQRTDKPYWLPDLKSLPPPDWQGVFWQSYRVGTNGGTCRAILRLSRGHTHCPADRAFGDSHEPLRFWPLDRLVSAIQKCGHRGVNEVYMADPPGLWTPDNLRQWCGALAYARNLQPWSLNLLPCALHHEILEAMHMTFCRRVDFILPSCDPEVLRRFGCTLSLREIASTMAALEDAGMEVHTRFWIGGPEEPKGETERVTHAIRLFQFRSYSLHPFPFDLDSPMYHEYHESAATRVDDWIQWARDPWIVERPIALWGGSNSAANIGNTFESINKAVLRNPQRIWKKIREDFRTKNLFSMVEAKIMQWSHSPPDGNPN